MTSSIHAGLVGRLSCAASIALAICLGACAEIELGAEAIKSVQRNAVSASQVAQARGLSGPIDPAMAEAPERFKASGVARWDGRGTLRGIWVAHPQAGNAQRVRIINPSTGRAADGALFRRDQRVDGPDVLISSEAAEAIGFAEGEAAEVVIVGLKPAEVLADASPAGIPLRPGENAVQVAETAALAPPEGGTAAKTQLAEAAPQIQAGRPEQFAQDQIGDSAPKPSDPVEPSDLAVAPQETEANDQAPATIGPGAVAAAFGSATYATVREGRPTKRRDSRVARAEPRRTLVGVTPEAQRLAARTGPIIDGQRYIQTGVFRDINNATRQVESLRASGLPAEGLSMFTNDGRRLTRVVAGPFDTYLLRNRALSRLHRMGLTDAIITRL
ncbi:MAG: SPOR domain-containing protein [Pseudomonadota bacterium]